MRNASLWAAVAALIVPVSATAADPKIFDMVVHSASYDGSQPVTSKGQTGSGWMTIAAVEMSLPSAIQLDGDVPADIQAKVGIGGKTPLTTGTVMYASGAQETVYCAPARSIIMDMMGAPCLVDTDGDGRFDAAAKSKNNTWQPDALVMSGSNILTVSKKYIMGMVLSASVPLPAPIPYHLVDSPPHVLGYLEWATNFGFKGTGPTQVMLSFCSYVEGSGGNLLSPPQIVTLTGAPVDVYMDGITVTITGIGQEGELSYTLNGKTGDEPTMFGFFQNARIIWPRD